MDETLRHQRDTSLGQLEALIRRGREIRNARSVDATRAWQQDCAAAIKQLSGGSKAHWLVRAYSAAFLVRASDGGVVVEADPTDIVDRILDVLAQGASSLSRLDEVEAASSGAAPSHRACLVWRSSSHAARSKLCSPMHSPTGPSSGASPPPIATREWRVKCSWS